MKLSKPFFKYVIQQFESHWKHPRRVVAGVGWDNERDLYVFDPSDIINTKCIIHEMVLNSKSYKACGHVNSNTAK